MVLFITDQPGGFGDETSWVPGVFAGEGAATIKDFDYKPKPAYFSIQDALRA
jgi:endo-1,4-beta-xylanase